MEFIRIKLESTGKANGFSPDEFLLLQELSELNHKYSMLDQTHPDDLKIWIDAIHRLQDLIAMRAIRRDYPGIFSSYEEVECAHEFLSKDGHGITICSKCGEPYE